MKTAAEKLRALFRAATRGSFHDMRDVALHPDAIDRIAQLLERANTYRVPESWERDYARLGQMLPEVPE